MPAERYFVDCSLESEVTIEGDEFHHLTRVMRARVGDNVELVNGKNILAQATLKTIGKNEAHLEITDIQISKEKKSLILAQGIPRLNRLEYILEKGTELNATEFWLFPANRSEKTEFSKNQMQRMHALLIAAMKQSGRLDLPSIHFKPPLLQWKKQELPLYFGDTNPEAPPLWTVKDLLLPLIFAIGPEGGFTSPEANHLHSLNAKGVSLHTNILRVDTASITALSLLSPYASI